MARPPLPLGEHGSMSLASRRGLWWPAAASAGSMGVTRHIQKSGKTKTAARLALEDELRAQRGRSARTVAVPPGAPRLPENRGSSPSRLRVPVTNCRGAGHAAIRRFLCVCHQAAGFEVVGWALAGPAVTRPKLVVGGGPAALDVRVAPDCPPGPAAFCRSSAILRS